MHPLLHTAHSRDARRDSWHGEFVCIGYEARHAELFIFFEYIERRPGYGARTTTERLLMARSLVELPALGLAP